MATAGPFEASFSTELLIASCTGSSGTVFPFVASYVRICNDAGVPVQVNLSSTAASTNDPTVKPGEQIRPVRELTDSQVLTRMFASGAERGCTEETLRWAVDVVLRRMETTP